VGPSHHSTACPRVADGGDGLHLRKVAANIFGKQSRTVDKGLVLKLGGWARV
jgi:hypothetical protein